MTIIALPASRIPTTMSSSALQHHDTSNLLQRELHSATAAIREEAVELAAIAAEGIASTAYLYPLFVVCLPRYASVMILMLVTDP